MGQVAATMVVMMTIRVVAILCRLSILSCLLPVRRLKTKSFGSLLAGFSTRVRSPYLCVPHRGMSHLRMRYRRLSSLGRMPLFQSTFMVLPCHQTGHGIFQGSGCRCYRVGHLGTMSRSLRSVRMRLFHRRLLGRHLRLREPRLCLRSLRLRYRSSICRSPLRTRIRFRHSAR